MIANAESQRTGGECASIVKIAKLTAGSSF